MRKICLLLSVILAVLLVAGCALLDNENANQKGSLYWEPDKSAFVDYDIIDDDTIKFRYSIHFVNNSKDDLMVSVSAKFKAKELKDWVKYESLFAGKDQNGERMYSEIKAGESADVIFVFEGEYLGGKVNAELSFPEELVVQLQLE